MAGCESIRFNGGGGTDNQAADESTGDAERPNIVFVFSDDHALALLRQDVDRFHLHDGSIDNAGRGG